METVQPWASGFNRPKPLTTQMQNGLSREERMEAKRLYEEANFSFAGYQVVRREFTSHRFDPAMTIRSNSVTFNNSCIKKLENTTYVQFLINPTEKKLIVRPCDSGARDAIRWCVVKSEARKSRQITCKIFADRLFEIMGWNKLYRYRFQGMMIKYQGEDMYLFDLKSDEHFAPQKKDENGKRIASAPILPDDWNDSFGMSVEEHDMSTKVDFLDGYISTSDTDDVPLEQQQEEQNEWN